ncbi:hypothetical protein [Aquirufa sp.]|jgi:hypothetical protein|uniref:hypothetical protein n=1 Tax=Aquirufa sp. TaxID=2676249 RepID=UPI003783F3E9
MQPLNIKLYDLARAKLNLNDTDAMEFVSSIHELQDHRFENLVTKEYLDLKLFGITEKMNQIDSNSIDRTNNLGISLFEKMSQIDSNSIDRTNKLETSLSEKINKLENFISEFKADNLKWMFIFWVGQMSVTIAVVMMLIKK